MVKINNRFTNEVMFTSENENQTFIEFVLELIKKRADLSRADLSGADLSGANLRSADLSGADLSGADLRSANLNSAYLSGAIMPIFCKWSTHGIVDGKIRIGCETRSIEDWDKFFASDEIITTPRNTHEFKQIRAVYESYKAYLTILNS